MSDMDAGLVQETRTPLQKVGTIVVDGTSRGSKSVFFCRGGNTTYIFKNGQVGVFARGTVPFSDEPAFVTDKIGYIAEMKEQIASGASVFYQDAKYESIQDEDLDPYKAIKEEAARKAIEEYKASLAQRDMGATESKPTLTGIANSNTIKDGAAGSIGDNSAALASLSSLTTK